MSSNTEPAWLFPAPDRPEREQTILEPVRARADYIIDTTSLSTAKLRVFSSGI